MKDINIPYGKQCITEEDVQAVIETLKSDYLTQGPKILAFEQAFAQYVGAQYAVAVANGTAALHLSTLALEVKPGDKVITTPITFAASANCVRYCGGDVIFGDIDPATCLLDINSVRALLETAPSGTYKGIIPVDFAGRAVDLEEFKALADEHGLWIIEDACHAPGGYFVDGNGNSQYCGNGIFADLAIFSFHPVKHITSGEGGMVTTNDEKLYKKLLQLRTHGIIRSEDAFTNGIALAGGENKYPGWYMEMQELGYNYRITDFQAALGLSQLKYAKERLALRRLIAKRYDEAFKNIGAIKLTDNTDGLSGHAYHLYVIQVENRLGLYNYLKENGIFAQVHYIPVHLMPYYKQFGWKPGDRPCAENYYQHCLSLPMYPTLSVEEQNHVIRTVSSFVDKTL